MTTEQLDALVHATTSAAQDALMAYLMADLTYCATCARTYQRTHRAGRGHRCAARDMAARDAYDQEAQETTP